jgi:integrase/recombinase XerD
MPAAHPIPGDPNDPDGFAALVAAFCEWMAMRGYSRHTIDRYHVSLALFADWAVERGVERPREVTRPIVERYQRALFHLRQPGNGKALAFRSQTARLVALRQFYRWLARSHRVLVNPTAELELPRVGRWQPRSAMTVPEVEDVLAQPDLNSPDGLRDRAMLEVF